MEFDDFTDMLVNFVDYKILQHNDDQLLLVCGYEGKGKSTLSIATQCEIYRKRKQKTNRNHIIFNWSEYLAANMQVIKNMMSDKHHYVLEKVQEWIDYYELDLNNPITKKAFEVDYEVYNGCVLVYDEAATQMHSRQGMTRKGVDQNKLLILNRFLKMMHLYNAPKPQSLEVYPREQRPRGMIWCVAEYTQDLKQRLRGAYFYTQDTYNEIFCHRYWWKLFSNDMKLVETIPPDFEIILPDNLLSLIPEEILQDYEAKKLVSAMHQTIGMWHNIYGKGDSKDKGSRDKEDKIDKLVQEGENKQSWSKRTGLSPGSYYNYKSHTHKPTQGT